MSIRKKYKWVGIALERIDGYDAFTTRQAFENILSESNNKSQDFPSRIQLGNQLRFDERLEKVKMGVYRRK